MLSKWAEGHRLEQCSLITSVHSTFTICRGSQFSRNTLAKYSKTIQLLEILKWDKKSCAKRKWFPVPQTNNIGRENNPKWQCKTILASHCKRQRCRAAVVFESAIPKVFPSRSREMIPKHFENRIQCQVARSAQMNLEPLALSLHASVRNDVPHMNYLDVIQSSEDDLG